MVIFLTWFSALSFLGYGISCVFTKHMHLEFERFRLVRFRVIVGVTQIAGAVGLLLGLYYPLIGILSAGGLALQMLPSPMVLFFMASIKDLQKNNHSPLQMMYDVTS